LAFENSLCLSCGSALGFSLKDMALLVITDTDQAAHAGAVDEDKYRLNAIGWYESVGTRCVRRAR
jgi:hypothetical protein